MATDAQLIAQAREDPRAFRELYERYAPRIHAYHRRRTRDEDAAMDLTAETFARAWLGRARFADEAGGSAAPWLFGIARNVLLESVRRSALERRASELLRLQPAATAAAPDASWLDGADELLDELSPALRRAVELRVLDDLPYEHVAARLGTTESAVRVRVHRALAALRARITRPTTETTR